MRIVIQNIRGDRFYFEVESNISVWLLKKHIEEKVEIEAAMQTLILGGRFLANDSILKDVDIADQVIHIMVKQANHWTNRGENNCNETVNHENRISSDQAGQLGSRPHATDVSSQHEEDQRNLRRDYFHRACIILAQMEYIMLGLERYISIQVNVSNYSFAQYENLVNESEELLTLIRWLKNLGSRLDPYLSKRISILTNERQFINEEETTRAQRFVLEVTAAMHYFGHALEVILLFAELSENRETLLTILYPEQQLVQNLNF